MTRLLAELRRRSVFRVAAAYAVVGWVIAQAVTLIYAPLRLPDWTPALVLVLLICGFPIALLLAWAFEMTPDGMRRTQPAPPGKARHVRPAGAADFALIALLAGVGAIAVYQIASRDGGAAAATALSEPAPRPQEAASIAVLPFVDLSPEGDQQYFSEGVSEELLNTLARAPELRVASRTSAFAFKGGQSGVREIAGALGVRHVLEGSVRKSGETVRITAQLIDAETDRHVWSETYDRTLTAESLFAIQDEIAAAIVAELRRTLGVDIAAEPPPAQPTDDLTAYDLFLRARAQFQARRDLDGAGALLARAVERDPGFAEAWALRAASLYLRSEYTDPPGPRLPEDTRVAATYAEEALRRDPDTATALALLALIEVDRLADPDGEWVDVEAVERRLDRALELEPSNASARLWRGVLFERVGLMDRAAADFRLCVEVDPLYAACRANLVGALDAMGATDEALAAYGDALDRGVMPQGAEPYFSLARSGERLVFMELMRLEPILQTWRQNGRLYDALREPGRDHSALMADLEAFARDQGVDPAEFGTLSAVAAIQGTPEARIEASPWIWHAALARYRGQAHFRDWARGSGAYDYWRGHEFPAVCRPVGADDFTCADAVS